MKKSTFLKLALMFVATFAFAGAYAQLNTGAAQWTVHTTVNDYTSAVNNKITTNKTMPFWAWPSAAYNPNFDYTTIVTFAPKATIITGVTSNFAWSSTGTPTITHVAADKNYATISWPLIADLGSQTISVTETPASGICPGTPVTFQVTLINVPAVTITIAASKFGLTDLIKSACWAVANDNTTAIPFVINNANEVYPYDFYLNYNIYNVDGLDGGGNLPVTGGNLNAADPSVHLLAYDSKVNGVVAGTPTKTNNPINVAAGLNLLPAANDFVAANSKITVYEFDLAGYNAKVSRTSDYLVLTAGNVAQWSSYSLYGAAAKYYIVSLPTPVTGPIYHISNTFAL